MQTAKVDSGSASEMRDRVWIWIEEPDKFHSRLTVVNELVDATTLQATDAEKITHRANQEYSKYLWQPVPTGAADEFVVRGDVRADPSTHTGDDLQEATDIRVRLGERVRSLRLERGWKQADMAETLGIDCSYLSEIENGREDPSLRVLKMLADGFKVSLSSFLSGM
jgi:ribosome-binding protein aMBF1 (putative translation factor)